MTARIDMDFPYATDHKGLTATTGYAGHVRDMIEQILFTNPGERVNRPDFGAGLLHAVFAAAGNEAATALEFTTRAALQRFLGDVIEVQALSVRADDAVLTVEIIYSLRARGAEAIRQTFTLGAAT